MNDVTSVAFCLIQISVGMKTCAEELAATSSNPYFDKWIEICGQYCFSEGRWEARSKLGERCSRWTKAPPFVIALKHPANFFAEYARCLWIRPRTHDCAPNNFICNGLSSVALEESKRNLVTSFARRVDVVIESCEFRWVG
jgi:hypothetical protein